METSQLCGVASIQREKYWPCANQITAGYTLVRYLGPCMTGYLKASFDAGIVIMASKCTRYPSQQYYSTVGTEPYLERLSGNVIKEYRCFPQALTPPAPLTITNGVVRSPANSGGRERQLVKWMRR